MEIIFILLIPVGIYMFFKYFLSLGESLRSSSPLPSPNNVPNNGWGCKSCLSEYEKDVSHCADCGEELIDFSSVPDFILQEEKKVPGFVIGEKRKKELLELEKRYAKELKEIRKKELDLKFKATKEAEEKKKKLEKRKEDLERYKKERLQVSHSKPEKRKRKPIPQLVKDKVWRRDEGKCVSCGSNESLEFDHIIPHSKNGSDTYRNLQLLCESCNRSKSNKIG
jgi:5-methylcytosine-specific restriction endonuclease McrA